MPEPAWADNDATASGAEKAPAWSSAPVPGPAEHPAWALRAARRGNEPTGAAPARAGIYDVSGYGAGEPHVIEAAHAPRGSLVGRIEKTVSGALHPQGPSLVDAHPALAETLYKHPWLGWLISGGEAVASLGTSTAGMIEGGLTAATTPYDKVLVHGASAVDRLFGGKGFTWNLGEGEEITRAKHLLSYAPHTREAQQIAALASLPYALATDADLSLGDTVMRHTHSPFLATLAGMPLRTLMIIGGGKSALEGRGTGEDESAGSGSDGGGGAGPDSGSGSLGYVGRRVHRYVESLKTPRWLRSSKENEEISATHLDERESAVAEDMVRHPEKYAAEGDALVPADTPDAQPVPAGLVGGRLYHGTGADIKRFVVVPNDSQLYGPGVYLTDDPEVASAYAQAAARRGRVAEGAGPNVTVAHTSASRFLDLRKPAGAKEVGWIAQALRTRGEAAAADALEARYPYGAHRGNALYRTLTDLLGGDKAKANAALGDAGFHGLKYAGGHLVGTVEHEATVVFDPRRVHPGVARPLRGASAMRRFAHPSHEEGVALDAALKQVGVLWRKTQIPKLQEAMRQLSHFRTARQLLAARAETAALSEGFTPEMQARLYDYDEEKLLDPAARTVVLTPKEQAFYERWIAPARERIYELAVQEGRAATIEEARQELAGYTPRAPVGEEGPIQRLIETQKGAGLGLGRVLEKLPKLGRGRGRGLRLGVGLLARRRSSLSPRTMMAITDEVGARQVVSVDRRAGPYRTLTAWREGEPKKLGRFRSFTGKQVTERAQQSVDAQIAALQTERGFLRPSVQGARISRINEDLRRLREEREQIPLNEPFQGIGHIEGREGNYQLGQATSREIETHSSVRYHRRYLMQLMNEIVSAEQNIRQRAFLDQFKQSAIQDGFAATDRAQHPDFETTRAVEARSLGGQRLYWHPKLATVFDHYDAMRSGDVAGLPVINLFNDLALEVMFLNPTWHMANVGAVFGVARGVRGVLPAGVKALYDTLPEAAEHVTNMSDKYLRLYVKSAPFRYIGQRLMAITPEAYGIAIESAMNELAYRDSLAPIREALGGLTPEQITKLAHKARSAIHSSVWWVNDVALMQRVLEHEKEGMSEDAALAQAERESLTYSVPQHYKSMNWMMRSRVFWFAAYHFDLFRIVGRQIKTALADSNATLAERARAADQLIMLAIAAYVVRPQIEAALHRWTGRKVRLTPFGTMEPAALLARYVKNPGDTPQVLTRLFSPSVGALEVVQQAYNRVLWTGKEVAPWYEPPIDQVKDRVLHIVRNFNYPVANYFDSHSIGQAFLSQFGIRVEPTDKERIRQAMLARYTKEREEHLYYQEHPDKQ